jgi:hypothetical protein
MIYIAAGSAADGSQVADAAFWPLKRVHVGSVRLLTLPHLSSVHKIAQERSFATDCGKVRRESVSNEAIEQISPPAPYGEAYWRRDLLEA